MNTMDDVRDDLRAWLSLRQWVIRIERNGTGFNVEADEHPVDRKATTRTFKYEPPIRTLAFHVSDSADVVAALDANGARTVCRCGGIVRVEDVIRSEEVTGDADQFACTACNRRWST